MRKLIGLFAACLALSAGAAMADEVGKVGVDWVGNDIMVDAIKDPKVDGVTCHVAYFDRSIIDRLHKGNWFEDPSDSSISCRQTGPI
ncbi:CREA protein, partial [Mesorhizobium sp. M2C.T.Ca.TU.009.01.2.1]